MQHVYWLAYALLPGLSLLKKHRLLERLGGINLLLEHLQSKQHPEPQIQTILENLQDLPIDQAKHEMEKLQQNNAWMIAYQDDFYPESLRHIADPPLVLFGRGIFPNNSEHYFGVVGTRKPSSYGQRVARNLCKDLSQNGLVLVSGLASGIDTIAHQACVDSSQPTLAVLGHGLGTCYPQQNEFLAKEILSKGCVLTEYCYDEPPTRYTFPKRNRIVAGLVHGLLLIEGAKKSGASITARLALENSKEVYAVPGMIDSPTAYVPNLLISQGAKVVLSADDILEDFDLKHNDDSSSGNNLKNELSPLQEEIMKNLSQEAQIIDDVLQAQLEVSDSDMLSAMVDLEQQGLIKRQFDGSWSKV